MAYSPIEQNCQCCEHITYKRSGPDQSTETTNASLHATRNHKCEGRILAQKVFRLVQENIHFVGFLTERGIYYLKFSSV